jgi:alpha,alpha-trehalose phosphorylase
MWGFGGLREYAHVLVFAPRLPGRLTRLTFPVLFRGRRLEVRIEPEAATYTLAEGDEPLEIIHWGERVSLEGGTPSTQAIPAAPDIPAPRQPPHREPVRARVR